MKKGIILTDRDKRIFCYLFEQKVAYFEEIRDRFFDNLHISTCFLRLQKLSNYEFIEKIAISQGGKLKTYFTLTKLGLKEVCDFYDINKSSIRLKTDSLEHDLKLSYLRNKLESCKKIKSYYSENYLHGCSLAEDYERLSPIRDINADAALHINGKSGDFLVSFEYERTLKNPSRYNKKLTDYYFNNSITAVFYLCESEVIERSIRKADRIASKGFSPKVFTFTTEKMKKANGNFSFSNQNNKVFQLEKYKVALPSESIFICRPIRTTS